MKAVSSKTRGLDFLPSLPHAVTKLLEASLDNSASLSGIADIAANDPGLASQILRLANSPLFGPGRKIASLPQAVINLGLQSVRNIAVSLSIYESFRDLTDIPEFSLANFWWHSLCTATCAKNLAVRVGYEHFEEAFIAGLLHDIGQLFLIRANPGASGKIIQEARTGHTLVKAERDAWGSDHAQTGAELLERWRLPPLVCDAVRYHHHNEVEVRNALLPVRIIFLSNRLSHYFKSKNPNHKDTEEIVRLLDSLLGLQPDVLDELTDSIFVEIEQTSRIFGIEICIDQENSPKEKLFDEEAERNLLKNKALDQALLIGSLQDMVSARNEKELFNALLRSLLLLFNFDKIFLAKKTGKNNLTGIVAIGSKQDEVASRIRIPCLQGTIWHAALEQKTPIHYDHFFSDKNPLIIDEQIANFLGGHFLIVPVTAEDEQYGVITVAISAEEWDLKFQHPELLMLLARHMALALKAHRYRSLLSREKALNAATLKAAPVAILLTDIFGKSRYWNPSAERLLGLDKKSQAAEGINVWNYLSLNEALQEDLLKRIESGEIFEVRGHEWVDTKGRPRWLDIKAVPLKASSHSKIVLSVEDVTASKLLEKEREEKARWLEEKLNERTDQLKAAQEKILQAERLVASSDIARKVSHEVANPLGIIKNFLRVLKIEEMEAGKNADVFNAIDREIDRIARIIQGLRDFSGDYIRQAGVSEGYIQNALKDILTLMERPLADKGIELDIHSDHDLPMLKLSEDGIKQILINLIKNAEDALESGGKITVRAYKQANRPEEVVIEVQDTGPGIPKELKDKIFDPFITTKGKENSGLGLSVCYGLIKAAGGSIKIKDHEGPGAWFEIRLPKADSNLSTG